MAEDKKAADKHSADGKAGGGKGKLIVILVVVLIVAGAAAGAGFMLAGHSNEAGAAAPHQPPPAKKSDAPPVFAKLETFVVNLSGGNTSLLQVDIQLELSDAEAQKKLTDYMPKVRSAVILLLSAKSPQEIATPQGKQKLREQIKQVINGALEAGAEEPVKSVLFTSFIVQNS